MHLVHSWLSQKLSNCILISYMRMSWFLHSLVNTWCCQIFLLILAIPIKRWSDVFWISLLTSDVKTSFYVVLGHPVSSCVVCVSVCVCARAHMRTWPWRPEANTVCLPQWFSIFVSETVSLTGLGLTDPAGQADKTTCSSNPQVSVFSGLGLQAHVTVPCVLRTIGGLTSGPHVCRTSTLLSP